MTTRESSELVEALRTLVRERYVVEGDVPAVVSGLDGLEDDLPTTDPQATAALLTERLQRGNGDRHLRVRFCPGGAVASADRDEDEARYAAEAVRNAGGIRTVRLLDDVTGLLAISPYTSPVHLAAPYVLAAFTLLQHVRHLVIDLREGFGGTPETIALLCGHLLGREPVHLQDVVEREAAPRQFWTTPAAVRLGDDVPVDVLTSARTFSGCEELAYDLQALGRARVVGETTGGGAHPVESFRLDDVLEAYVPVGASVNAVTGTSWEQVGVVPDVACAAADALDVALRGRAAVPA